MSNKRNKAPKNTSKKMGFFGALFYGFVSCAVTWIFLASVLALVISMNENPIGIVPFASPFAVVVSLAVGGFVFAKLDKSNAVLLSLVLGVFTLGLSYALTIIFELKQNFSPAIKTVVILMMLLSPLVGAKLASGRGNKRRKHKRM